MSKAVVSLDDNQVDECLNYVGSLVAILERKVKILQNKEIPLVKVQWEHCRESEWTWEPEVEMWKHYPEMFTVADFEDEV